MIPFSFLPPDLGLDSAQLPLMVPVRQTLHTAALADAGAALRRELEALPIDGDLKDKRVAIGVGSRGLDGLVTLVRVLADFFQERGARPFIVPAMGSHGGATAEGQQEVLAGYGVTADAMGVPIISSMETVLIGRTPDGAPVYCDAAAWAADCIVPLNRVKPHTQFRASTESGLLKMLAVGFGKDKGAAGVHGLGIQGLVTLIPAFARVLIDSGKVLFGVAVVEDGRHRTAKVRAIPGPAIAQEEPTLLREAWEFLPRLPVDTLDMLVLDRMGKDISGPGVDSSVTGRIMDNNTPDPPFPAIRLIAVLDLTEASHGNAVGVGLADFISLRLLKKIDLRATYLNAIIGGFPVQGKIPMAMPDDRSMFRAAAVLLGATPLAKSRLIHADSTLELELLHVSQALLPELSAKDGLEILGPPAPMTFDDTDNLVPLSLL